MKNKQTDKSKETANKILNCYLRMRDETGDKPISVSQLCKRAEINRGTFYLHFDSINDLVEQLETHFFEEIKAQINQVKLYSLDENFFSSIIDIIVKNELLSKWISINQTGQDFLKKLRSFIADKFASDFNEKYPSTASTELNLVLSFIIGGATDMLLNWFKEGRKEDRDVIAKSLGRFAITLINTVLEDSSSKEN